jgi:hypothetical protein
VSGQPHLESGGGLRDPDPRKERRIMETNERGRAATREARRNEWRQVLTELDASGESAAMFGRKRGIPAWKLLYWRHALKPVAAQSDGGFVQVGMRAKEWVPTLWVETGRWRVGVAPGFDRTTLRQIVEALDS